VLHGHERFEAELKAKRRQNYIELKAELKSIKARLDMFLVEKAEAKAAALKDKLKPEST